MDASSLALGVGSPLPFLQNSPDACGEVDAEH